MLVAGVLIFAALLYFGIHFQITREAGQLWRPIARN